MKNSLILILFNFFYLNIFSQEIIEGIAAIVGNKVVFR